MRRCPGRAKVGLLLRMYEMHGAYFWTAAVETLPRVLLDAKKAFALACVEQLVPVLSEAVIQSQVYPLCYPYVAVYICGLTANVAAFMADICGMQAIVRHTSRHIQ